MGNGNNDASDMQGPGNQQQSSGHLTPRVEHFDGEVPPALSPLDAFALQSRLLAKQFEESNKAGRRMSRLPPSSVERSFSQPRPGYIRANSSSDSQKPPASPGYRGHGSNWEIEEPKFRPKSQHPQLSGTPNSGRSFDNNEPSVPPLPSVDFGAPRAKSPEGLSSSRTDAEGKQSPNQKQSRTIGIGVTGLTRKSTQDSSSRVYTSNTLAPPSSGSGPTSSPGPPQPESSDDDYYASSNTGSTFSKPRKLSSSSGVSMPSQSPMSHFNRPPPARSPSPASEVADMTQGLPKPAFNFSRPMSRSSTSISLPSPLVEAPNSSSQEDVGSGEMRRERRPPPIDLPQPYSSGGGEVEDGQASAGNSYIYTKYTLPRGRRVSRNSLVFSGLQTPLFEWKEPLFENSPPPTPNASQPKKEPRARTPSPPRPSQSTSSSKSHMLTPPVPKQSPPARLVKKAPSSPVPARPPSFDQGAVEKLPVQKRIPSDRTTGKLQPADNEDDDDAAKTPSTRSESTIRPSTSQAERDTNVQLSADEHVEKGIECHENGSLKESTYHLRRAAMQNHPTGMLLYALACRHGWGIRPNQKEGVQWLRKAVDSAGLDANGVGRPGGEARGRNLHEQKAQQAQFALGIYELGVSHLNGWGIEQDKALALRCFEIAAHWGDADALAEAGYCYADGIGCKKDLKKAARYYRQAEKKGMSMVGNSWIYKDKYMSDDDSGKQKPPSLKSNASSRGKKPRPKSRTRSIFARKKTNVDDET